MEVFLIGMIKVLYFGFNSLRVLSYGPQIRSVAKDKSSAKSISLITWIFWTCANLITAVYAQIIAKDLLLALMSYGNTVCCGIVVGIVLYKRKKYAEKSTEDYELINNVDVV